MAGVHMHAKEIADLNGFVRVGGYLVAPKYVTPIGIGACNVGDALTFARVRGFELPTPELVNQIWQSADLRIAPQPMTHDGSDAMIGSQELRDIHENAVGEAVVSVVKRNPSRTWRLLAGTHIDVVWLDGGMGAFGAHRLDGRPMMPPSRLRGAHYALGLRLVRKVA